MYHIFSVCILRGTAVGSVFHLVNLDLVHDACGELNSCSGCQICPYFDSKLEAVLFMSLYNRKRTYIMMKQVVDKWYCR